MDVPLDGTEYALMCYSDAQRLYENRGFDRDVMPYIGAEGSNPDGTPRGFLEYPVLTGIFLYIVAILSSGETGFIMMNAALLGVFALATTLLLLALVEEKQRIVFWVAAPPLILYAFHNWDLLAIFFATLAVFAFSRAQWVICGVACALGATAKIYPGLFIPIFGLAILREEGRFGRQTLMFGLSVIATFAIVNAPFVLMNPRLWWLTYEMQLGRAPNFESIYHILVVLGTDLGQPWLVSFATGDLLGMTNLILLVATVTWVGYRLWNHRIAPTQAAFAVMLAFLFLNKVYSVQYTLWIVPFFALLSLPLRKYGALVVTDTFAYILVFTKLTLNEEDSKAFYPFIATAILLRAAVQGWLFIGVVQRSPREPLPAPLPR